jgi:hypothetical protein
MEFFQAIEAGVLDLIQLLMPTWLLKPVIKPFVRLILGLLVIPVFRLFLHRVVRKELDQELERDISLWLRGSLLLLIANSNMEALLFSWVPPEKDWLKLALRILLGIGVVEGMPDQALFLIIHPGPPPIELRPGRRLADLLGYAWPILRGTFNQYLNRSSAVLVILSVVLDPGPIAWICYGMAITNYLIIGLVSSRDKALDVLSKFDEAVTEKRREIELAVLKHDQLGDERSTVAAIHGATAKPEPLRLAPEGEAGSASVSP